MLNINKFIKRITTPDIGSKVVIKEDNSLTPENLAALEGKELIISELGSTVCRFRDTGDQVFNLNNFRKDITVPKVNIPEKAMNRVDLIKLEGLISNKAKSTQSIVDSKLIYKNDVIEDFPLRTIRTKDFKKGDVYFGEIFTGFDSRITECTVIKYESTKDAVFYSVINSEGEKKTHVKKLNRFLANTFPIKLVPGKRMLVEGDNVLVKRSSMTGQVDEVVKTSAKKYYRIKLDTGKFTTCERKQLKLIK